LLRITNKNCKFRNTIIVLNWFRSRNNN